MSIIDYLRIRKAWAFAAADVFLTLVSVLIAFWLRFDGRIPLEYWGRLWLYMALLAALNVFFVWRERLYIFTWAFMGLQDLTRLVRALTYSSVLFAALLFLDFGTTNFFGGFPRSVIFIAYFLNLIFIGSLRISKRLWLEAVNRSDGETGVSTLIIGAGSEGERLIRDLRGAGAGRYAIIGILDENKNKQKTLLHGVPVLGYVSNMSEVVSQHQIQQIVVALPSGDSETIKKAVRAAREAGVQNIKIIPPFSEMLEKKIALEALKDITIEDLLGREVAKLETAKIGEFIRGKRVLVTGAAGSIGSELARQISKFEPENLIILDFNESGIYDLEHELQISFPDQKLYPVVASVTDSRKIDKVFSETKPQVVFHAAAYKHVPLMEYFPEEAVTTNIFGTLILAETAIKHGVQKFVFISTDKAVKPVSVMGKTKRIAEIIVNSLNKQNGTQFVSVRFGNVLASRGSVVPLFQEQIRRRAAITVTHPDMKRYFMTIPEAALLVTEAGAVGGGGEIFILDMGEPVKIVDLAHELIKLSGLEPDKDIPIVFTGVRPGEKIFEELLTDTEGASATKWEKIFVSKNTNNLDFGAVSRELFKLKEKLYSNPAELTHVLSEAITSLETVKS